MALYAVDGDDILFAGYAERGKTYWCLDCFGPVKRRQGKNQLPHFYHTQSAPQCRLHSKTEDHLRAQLQLKNHFPSDVLQIERPFSKISRIADICWENEKIIFEVQCSPITPQEVELRIKDYGSLGYSVIWLLDDKRYNKRVIRPAEDYLRTLSTYYLTIRQELTSEIYDQFEVFANGLRVKRGKRMPIDLAQIARVPKIDLKEELFPKQVLTLNRSHYFFGDRTHRALQAKTHSFAAMAMLNWRALEIQLGRQKNQPSRIRKLLSCYLLQPYRVLLQRLIRWTHKYSS